MLLFWYQRLYPRSTTFIFPTEYENCRENRPPAAALETIEGENFYSSLSRNVIKVPFMSY